MNKKTKWKMRLGIILLPFVLSFLFLFSPFERIELSRENITGDITLSVSEDDVFKPSFQNTLRDILQVPFDLKWYDICFVNKDTKMVYRNSEFDKGVNVSLNFNNQKEFTIPYGRTECVTYKFNKNFTYTWKFLYSINFSKAFDGSRKTIFSNETEYITEIGSVTMKPSVDSYAKPELSGIIVKNILFLIIWSGLVLLFSSVIKFIRGKE